MMAGSGFRLVQQAVTVVVVAILVSHFEAGAQVVDVPVRNDQPISIDTQIDRDEDFHRLSAPNDRLSYQSEIEVELASKNNSDLDRERQRNETGFIGEYTLAAAYRQNDRLQFYGRLQFGFESEKRQTRSAETETELRVKELNSRWRSPDRSAHLTLGRQEIIDARRWLIDEDIDGISYVWRSADEAWQLLAGRENLLRLEFWDKDENDDPNFYLIRYYRRLAEQHQGSVYLAHVDQRGFDDDEKVTHLGGRLLGQSRRDSKYWAHAAVVRGNAGSRRVNGFGFDFGFTKRLEAISRRPYLSAGIAYGSGDDGGATDTAFRQTGLHSNKSRFGGLASFRYYGHVFDPQLSNMMILTAGIGVRPQKNWSVDLVWHRYYQARASTRLRDVRIDADPDGQHRNLGNAIDLVIGLRSWRRADLDIEAVFGAFKPGPAFGDSGSNAYHAEVLVTWKF